MNHFHCMRIIRRLSFLEVLVFVILSSVLLLMASNRFAQTHSECRVAKRHALLSESLNSVMLHNLCEIGDEAQYVCLVRLDNGLNVNAWYYNRETERLTHLYNTEIDNQRKPRLVTHYLKSVHIPATVTLVKGQNNFVQATPAATYIFGDAYPRFHIYGGQFIQILDDAEWKHPTRPYRAVTAGPYIDAKSETVFRPGMTPEPTLTIYDPSNGVQSHGYMMQTMPGFFAQETAQSEFPLITARLR